MNLKLKTTLCKIFAISGAVLLWAPILFMFLTAIVGSIVSQTLLFDYLALAEFSMLVVTGLILLVLASILARVFRKWFVWGSVAALAALFGGLLFASASGLASGAIGPGGAAFAVVIAAIVVYNVLVVALAVLAIVMIKRLFVKQPAPEAAPVEQ